VINGWGFQLRDVRVDFGSKSVLSHVDLVVKPGENVALLGPSGAGKTTLLRLLNRALIPSSGHVLVDGKNLAEMETRDLRRLRSGIGFVHQDLRLVPNLRVSQNVLSGSLGRRNFFQSLLMFLKPARDDLLEVHRLLEQVGISQEMFQRVDRLSGGQMQRVALARALFQKPGLLLTDEPVSSVDPARAADLMEILAEISRDQGTTLCASLHDPQLVLRFFPRIVGLRQGRVVFDKPTTQISPEEIQELYALAAEDGI
jgi:phosphonate transport system ATP-binding protein